MLWFIIGFATLVLFQLGVSTWLLRQILPRWLLLKGWRMQLRSFKWWPPGSSWLLKNEALRSLHAKSLGWKTDLMSLYVTSFGPFGRRGCPNKRKIWIAVSIVSLISAVVRVTQCSRLIHWPTSHVEESLCISAVGHFFVSVLKHQGGVCEQGIFAAILEWAGWMAFQRTADGMLQCPCLASSRQYVVIHQMTSNDITFWAMLIQFH